METSLSTRVLVVADWKIDPHAVVAACARYRESHDASFGLVVPAWLHGLDWAGDPAASVPCAERQLEQIRNLCRGAGLPVHRAEVGDPDAVTAVTDALLSEGADELVVCVRDAYGPGRLFDIVHRVERATGLPAQRVAVPAARRQRRPRAWNRLRRGHCATAA